VKRVLAIAIALLAPGAIEAQRIQPEIRFETLGPEYQGLLGVALHWPMGRYVRVGVGGTGFAIGRTDLIGRFTFDPNRQMRWALAAGGGLSYDAESKKLYLAVHSDLEGPRMGSISPFVSAGLAGGARFAVGMRRAFQNRR
jgi:hypothetical protein